MEPKMRSERGKGQKNLGKRRVWSKRRFYSKKQKWVEFLIGTPIGKEKLDGAAVGWVDSLPKNGEFPCGDANLVLHRGQAGGVLASLLGYEHAPVRRLSGAKKG
jgi:hypothetical protein